MALNSAKWGEQFKV